VFDATSISVGPGSRPGRKFYSIGVLRGGWFDLWAVSLCKDLIHGREMAERTKKKITTQGRKEYVAE
jgi:hypothetical protein